MVTFADIRNMALSQPGVIGARAFEQPNYTILVEAWIEEETAVERLHHTFYNNLPIGILATVRIMDSPVPADALPSQRGLPQPYIDGVAESRPQLAISISSPDQPNITKSAT